MLIFDLKSKYIIGDFYVYFTAYQSTQAHTYIHALLFSVFKLIPLFNELRSFLWNYKESRESRTHDSYRAYADHDRDSNWAATCCPWTFGIWWDDARTHHHMSHGQRRSLWQQEREREREESNICSLGRLVWLLLVARYQLRRSLLRTHARKHTHTLTERHTRIQAR